MRFAGTIRFDIAEIADVTRSCIVSGMWRFRRIEMPAGSLAIRRRTITKFVNVKTVFAWSETGHVSDNFHFITAFGERDCAFNFAVFGGMQNGDCLGRFLREGSGESDQKNRSRCRNKCGEEISFHAMKLHLSMTGCKMQR